MKPSIIVWDLETVPDLPGFAAANDLVGKRDADIREALWTDAATGRHILAWLGLDQPQP
jgi:hypothetical protein